MRVFFFCFSLLIFLLLCENATFIHDIPLNVIKIVEFMKNTYEICENNFMRKIQIFACFNEVMIIL